MKEFFVYIIECMRTSKTNFGKLIYYTGLTDNPLRRLLEHKGTVKSNFMKRHKIKPLRYVHLERVENYFIALKREKQIKRMPLKQKLKLCNNL